jgi:hypothetical protein
MAAASKARQFHTQQTHFLRGLMNFNDPDIAGRKLGTVPVGSNILSCKTCASTANNAGTSATLSVGFSAGGTDLVNATNVAAATGIVNTLAPSGKSLLGSDTDIYMSLAMAGTAATTGVCEAIVEYVPPL